MCPGTPGSPGPGLLCPLCCSSWNHGLRERGCHIISHREPCPGSRLHVLLSLSELCGALGWACSDNLVSSRILAFLRLLTLWPWPALHLTCNRRLLPPQPHRRSFHHEDSRGWGSCSRLPAPELLRQPARRRGPIVKGCHSNIVPFPGTPQALFPGLRQMLASLQAGSYQTSPSSLVIEKGSESVSMLSLTQPCPSVWQGH